MSFQAKIVNRNSGTVFIDDSEYRFDNTHPKFVDLLECIKNDNADDFLVNFNFNPVTVLKTVAGVAVTDDGVFYNGEQIHSSLVDRILEMVSGGFDVKDMLLFLENLMKNPSRQSIEELYDFLSNSNLPITDDGCFLAYKSVVKSRNSFVDKNGRQVSVDDLVDKYTRTFRNAVGDVLEMERRQVDDDRRKDCSYGFHAGALEYVTNFYRGDQIVIVKINPKDVVSVPLDYNCQKLRTCRYEVVALYAGTLNRPVYTNDDSYEYDEDYDEDEEYYVDLDDLYNNDVISFMYEYERRYAIVNNVDRYYIHCSIIEGDPSWNKTSSNIRMFIKNKISNVTYI